MNIVKIIVALSCLLCFDAKAQFFFSSSGAAGNVLPVSNLIKEQFEGSGSGGYTGTNVWTWTASGTINSNYNAVATNILSGAYSLLMVSSAQTVNTYVSFANQTNAVGYMLFKRLSSSSNYRLFSGVNSSGTVVFQVVLDNNQKLTIRAGSGTAIVGVNSVPQGTTVALRWSYALGTGANAFGSVEWTTNGVFAGASPSNGNYVEDLVGNATTSIGRLRLGADNSTGFNNVWDNVYVSTATATNDFSNLHP